MSQFINPQKQTMLWALLRHYQLGNPKFEIASKLQASILICSWFYHNPSQLIILIFSISCHMLHYLCKRSQDFQRTVSSLNLNISYFFIYFMIVPYLSYAFSNVVTLPSSDNKKIGFFFVFLLWKSVKQCFPFHSWEPCPITQLKLNLVEREWELLLGSGWKWLLGGSAPMFSTNTLQGKEEL